MKACVSTSDKLLCLLQTPKNYATHAREHSIRVWQSDCSGVSSPSSEELHGSPNQWAPGLIQQKKLELQITQSKSSRNQGHHQFGWAKKF